MLASDYLRRHSNSLTEASKNVLNHLIAIGVDDLNLFANLACRTEYEGIFNDLNRKILNKGLRTEKRHRVSIELASRLMHFGLRPDQFLPEDLRESEDYDKMPSSKSEATLSFFRSELGKSLAESWRSDAYTPRKLHSIYSISNRHSEAQDAYLRVAERIKKAEDSIVANQLVYFTSNFTGPSASDLEAYENLQRKLYNVTQNRLLLSGSKQKKLSCYVRTFALSPFIPWWGAKAPTSSDLFVMFATNDAIDHVRYCLHNFPNQCEFWVQDETLLRNHIFIDDDFMATEDYEFSHRRQQMIPLGIFIDYSLSERLESYRKGIRSLLLNTEGRKSRRFKLTIDSINNSIPAAIKHLKFYRRALRLMRGSKKRFKIMKGLDLVDWLDPIDQRINHMESLNV